MANEFAYFLLVKAGQVFSGASFDAPGGSTFTGTYRDAPRNSGSSVSLPSVGDTAGSDIYAEVEVGSHAFVPSQGGVSVQSVVAGTNVTVDDADPRNPIVNASGGGGVPAGVAIVRAFPFTFNSPNLTTGHALYTPTIGDLLLDAWFEINTAWNGTSPTGDIFITGNGFYATMPELLVDMSDAVFDFNGVTAGGKVSITERIGQSGPTINRILPGRFDSETPVKVVVSQDGSVGGVDPGSSAGAAVLYLVTCTPA